MADKKVIYKEPKGYFSDAMLKAAREYDKSQAKKAAEANKQAKAK